MQQTILDEEGAIKWVFKHLCALQGCFPFLERVGLRGGEGVVAGIVGAGFGVDEGGEIAREGGGSVCCGGLGWVWWLRGG